MPSESSPVKEALESYVAGRVKAERLVVAVAAEYYRDALNPKGLPNGRGKREMLRPLIDVIDRASPGIVELGTVQDRKSTRLNSSHLVISYAVFCLKKKKKKKYKNITQITC